MRARKLRVMLLAGVALLLSACADNAYLPASPYYQPYNPGFPPLFGDNDLGWGVYGAGGYWHHHDWDHFHHFAGPHPAGGFHHFGHRGGRSFAHAGGFHGGGHPG